MRAWPFLMMMLLACDGFETTHAEVDEGNEALAQNDVVKALAAYEEATKSVGGSALAYDLGLALSAQGDQDKALKQLLDALRPADDGGGERDPDAVAMAKDLRQRVNAALGLAHARAALKLEQMAPAPSEPAPGEPPKDEKDKKPDGPNDQVMAEWKLAVTFLEDALREKPDDIESRRTLEVALLRVDPPCSARDDKYEENDVAGAPKLLEPKAPEAEQPQESSANPEPQPAQQSGPADELKLQEQLFSCPDDDDWYALDLQAGDRLSITLTVPPGKGKLELTLEKPSGEVVAKGLTASATVGANEAGKWLVSVKNIELDEVSYGLEVNVRPRCDKTEDRFEENDAQADAKLLTPGALPDLKLCPNDEDWYAVDLAEGESLFLFAQAAQDPNAKKAPKPKVEPGQPQPPPPPPPFALEIRDATGTVRNTGGPSGDSLVATLLTPGAGRYEVRVFPREPGSTWEGRYSLMIQIVPPCPEGDDRFEDNDVSQDATDFMQASQPQPQDGQPQPQPQPQQQQQGPPVVFARVCPGDVDWWTITDDGQKPAVWTATFDHGQGDLALTLYDENGLAQIASSNTSSPQQNGEAVPLPVAPKPEPPKPDPNNPQAKPDPAPEPPPPTPTKYTLKVAGVGEGQNFYLLRLDRPQGGGDGDSQDQDQDQDQNDDKQDPSDQQKDQGDNDEQDKHDKQKQDDEDQSLQRANIDNADRNPENLEAKESAKASPRANQKPIKDW